MQADVLLSWTPSPSADIASQKLYSTVNGVSQPVVNLAAGVASYTCTLQAMASMSWSIQSIDIEGKAVLSETETFQIGDLIDPFPATNLTHAVIAVRA